MNIGDLVYRKDKIGFKLLGYGIIVEDFGDFSSDDLPAWVVLYKEGLHPEYECDLHRVCIKQS